MQNLINGAKDIAASKAGKEITVDDVKDFIDIDKDKKFTKADLWLWLKLIGQSLLIGFVLSLYYNFDSIIDLLQGSNPIDWIAIVQQLVISSLAFTYKAAKQSATSKMKEQENIIKTQAKEIKLRDNTIEQNNKITEDIITTYENQLFLFETDLAGKTKASKTKDEIARALIAKYEPLEEIYKKSHPLPDMGDVKIIKEMDLNS